MDAFMVNVDDISMAVQEVACCNEQIQGIALNTSNRISQGMPGSPVLQHIQNVSETWSAWQAEATQLIAKFSSDINDSVERYKQIDSNFATEFRRVGSAAMGVA